ncbi:unnamed protein product [Sphagnum balticum]
MTRRCCKCPDSPQELQEEVQQHQVGRLRLMRSSSSAHDDHKLGLTILSELKDNSAKLKLLAPKNALTNGTSTITQDSISSSCNNVADEEEEDTPAEVANQRRQNVEFARQDWLLSEAIDDTGKDNGSEVAAGIVCYSSDHDNAKPVYRYEITLATSDRHGLLNFFTSALTNSTSLQLGIKEAHVFSTTDGMALEVFVVDGWPTDEDSLHDSTRLPSVLRVSLGGAEDGSWEQAAACTAELREAVSGDKKQIVSPGEPCPPSGP